MLSNSCYLTTLFYAIALFHINVFIKSSLMYEQSLICTVSAVRGLLYFMFVLM